VTLESAAITPAFLVPFAIFNVSNFCFKNIALNECLNQCVVTIQESRQLQTKLEITSS